MTDLKLYNTLTRQKEVFKPIDPDNVRMYVCGPTVYDFAHIGNARPVIVFDVLYRLLQHVYGDDHVTYVRNITDVDDKINARALRDFGEDIKSGKLTLNDAIRSVTEKTANQFHSDVEALGCLPPTIEPRATEYIDGMIEMIQTLIAKGHAYVATGREGREVLFDVGAMPEYGQLSKRKLEEQQAGARVAVEDHKKNPADFVLWKESSETEPGWDAEFDGSKIYGRPGWHIECSVMSKENLGEVFDIHGGGLDLIFPHHENEIAQSCCAHGTEKMAEIWMHNGYLQVEGRKMSKSEGNFVTIHDLLTDWNGFAWPGQVARFAMLKSHYRQPLDFSFNLLTQADIELSEMKDYSEISATPPTDSFVAALADDLNTPKAIAELHKLLKEAKSDRESKTLSQIERPLAAEKLYSNLQFFGVDMNSYRSDWLQEQANSGIDGDRLSELDEAINHRLALLAEKNYAEADKIRDELLAQGIQLKDSKDSETGERITTWEIKR
ncbi:MAG: cysteine--tRNA ligase [Pseudomonadota bacterium]